LQIGVWWAQRLALEIKEGQWRLPLQGRYGHVAVFVKSRARQGKVRSNPPQDIRLLQAWGSPNLNQSVPARHLV
jgi:hypothetical protein